ncbi:MAG: hypothetical protein E7812_13250 [Phenylobacterium sp.]|nr:MAG: hypothetical protein E7812_13250 [Phenylobacterium sp.]
MTQISETPFRPTSDVLSSGGRSRRPPLVARYADVETSGDPAVPGKWSRSARLAFIIGAATAFWSLIGVAVIAFLR